MNMRDADAGYVFFGHFSLSYNKESGPPYRAEWCI